MSELSHLSLKAGFGSTASLAHYLEVNTTTVTRWKKGDTAVPRSVLELLKMMGGQPHELARNGAFSGFRYSGTYLYTDSGDRYTAGDIRNIKSQHALIRALNVEIKRLKLDAKKAIKKSRATSNIIHFPTLFENKA